MNRIEHVVGPGTFDPSTYGHIDVVRRARRIAGRVTVAVAASLGKNGTGPKFTLDERVELARRALADEGVSEGVDVRSQASVGLDAHICQVRLLALAQERGQRGPSQKLDMCALCADKRAFCARIQL